jgi:YVTN family beta-propeller protein
MRAEMMGGEMRFFGICASMDRGRLSRTGQGGLIAVLGLLAASLATPASAFMAYVSNEKDNTVTVVDTTTMQVVKTIKTGQRPRITISHDGKFVYLCASDDDAIEIIDTATSEIVGTLPSGPDPELSFSRPMASGRRGQ